MGRLCFFCGVACLALGLNSSAAHAVGLSVGVFGGYAVPTGDMAAEEGFDLRPSTALGVRAFFDVHEYLGADLAAAYDFNFPSGVKRYEERVEITELMPVNVGAYYKTEIAQFRFSAGGGAGYYFLKTKLVTAMELYDSGFGVSRSVRVNFNAPGLHGGGMVSYAFGKFAVAFAPRYHYVFNSGEYDGEIVYGGNLKVVKNWDDSYFEVLAGVVYNVF